MFSRLFSPLTLANQLVLIVLLLALSGIAGMSLSGWIAHGIQGSAHAINISGSLRMQSYRLLAATPLTPDNSYLLTVMERDLNNPELVRVARRDNQLVALDKLRDYWSGTLRPNLETTNDRAALQREVGYFVGRIDSLVRAFDRMTEERIGQVVLLQKALAVLMALVLVFTIIWLHKRLLQPWHRLLNMAQAVANRDFSQRINSKSHDEMGSLSQAFDDMSSELAASYSFLEQRVAEKTAGLAQKNEMMSFLYRASRQLHMNTPIGERIEPVFAELERLSGLQAMTLRIYETEDEERYQEQTLRHDDSVPRAADTARTLKWRLTDSQHQYGLVLALMPPDGVLTQDKVQMIDTLMEQLTATLAQEHQTERRQQLMVMEERSAIARELHDSIAQSLSCMKMQVSCLQMQKEAFSPENLALLGQIRDELNTSWRQLRELLTTFRLKLDEPGLRPALESSCQEFSDKMGIDVKLDYQLPPRWVPSHQAIHVVQIVREALNNSYKHAAASEAGVTVSQKNHHVHVRIWDNGRGFDGLERNNHYGLVIMRDRAQSLRGDIHLKSHSGEGTEITVTFLPDHLPTSPTGVTHE